MEDNNPSQDFKAFTVTLDTNDTVLLTAASAGTTLVGTYTVGDGDTSAGSMAVAVMPIGTMQRRIPRKKKTIKETPIQPNLDEPTNPDIYGTKANPSNLN